MLHSLSGTVHEVLTGVVVVAGDHEEQQIVRTRVRFLPLSSEEIAWYLRSGEPLGKAGAYGIRGAPRGSSTGLTAPGPTSSGSPSPPCIRCSKTPRRRVFLGGLSSPQLLMSSKPIKIGATLVILGLAFAGLMCSSLSEGTEYDKHVDEVMSDPGAWHGKRLQLHGFVVDHSILRKPDTLDYRFQVQNNGKVVPARYRAWCRTPSRAGPKWCSRASGQRRLRRRANGVMAKCPSKYEAKPTPATSGG